MKEYKTIVPKLGIIKRAEKLEELLNQYAREGWQLHHVNQAQTLVIFERNKNR